MNANYHSAEKSRAVIGVCAVLLAPAAIAWLVNLELAVKIFVPSWKFIEVILPDWIFRSCVILSVDMSTVSTFVPLLLLLFPFIQAIKARRGCLLVPAAGNEWLPYPPHFPYFLIMFGLFGTLYGLLIGLEVSGVEGFIAYRPTTDSISQSLTRLLAGTSTAIWSSLMGLTGAFLAAQPIPWLFRRMVGVKQPPETVSLADTIHSLTLDLRGLGEASREFRKMLAPETMEDFFRKMDGLAAGLRHLSDAVERTTSAVEKLAAERRQEMEILREQTAELRKISAPVQHLEEIRETGRKTLLQMESARQNFDKATGLLSGWTAHLEGADEAARQSATVLGRIAGEELPAYSLAVQQKLDGIAESNRDNLRQLREEREAFRRSMAAYLKAEETEKT